MKERLWALHCTAETNSTQLCLHQITLFFFKLNDEEILLKTSSTIQKSNFPNPGLVRKSLTNDPCCCHTHCRLEPHIVEFSMQILCLRDFVLRHSSSQYFSISVPSLSEASSRPERELLTLRFHLQSKKII